MLLILDKRLLYDAKMYQDILSYVVMMTGGFKNGVVERPVEGVHISKRNGSPI